MSQGAKAVPEGQPPSLTSLETRVRQVAAGAADEELRIRLAVSGGTVGERYRLDVTAHASGQIEVRLQDELRKIDREAQAAELAEDALRRLFGSADIGRLSEAALLRQPIPPCSLVGRLTVTDGREEVTAVFMADYEQAQEAEFRVHPAVESVVDQLNSLVSRHLGVKP